MAAPSKVLLFGDQTVDPSPVIKQLHRQSKDSVVLRSFFQQSCDALRQEIASYESSERSTFPFFDSIQGLTDAYSQNGSPNEAISTALLCISQLGLLLMYVLDEEAVRLELIHLPCTAAKSKVTISSIQHHPQRHTCWGYAPACYRPLPLLSQTQQASCWI